MKEESLGSKIDTKYSNIIPMSLLGNRDEEPISSQYDIGAFVNRSLYIGHSFGVQERLYLSEILRACIIEEHEIISFHRCRILVMTHIEDIIFLYWNCKYWWHIHLMSIDLMTTGVYVHHIPSSSREVLYSLPCIILWHHPLELVIRRTYLIFICCTICVESISWDCLCQSWLYSHVTTESADF